MSRPSIDQLNGIRARRIALRRDVFDRKASLAVLVESCPSDLATIRITELLLWGARPGHHSRRDLASRWMREAGIGPYKTLGGLTERQRCTLADLVAAWERQHGRRAVA